MQNVGADISTFQGFKQGESVKENPEIMIDGNLRDPFWLIMKNYDYLSFDHEKGMTQWSIFFSEFSQSKDVLNDKVKQAGSQSSSLVHHAGPASDLIQDNIQIFVSGNTLYSLTID